LIIIEFSFENFLDMCDFVLVIVILNYVFSFILLVTRIKYINFLCIILAPPTILVKIRHCLYKRLSDFLNDII